MMEKRIFGIILTVLGIAGLIWAAADFVNNGVDAGRSYRALIVYGVLGLIFFFAGLGLIRSTNDNSTR